MKTTIEVDTCLAGSSRAHYTAFSDAELADMKSSLGMDPAEYFFVDQATKHFFQPVVDRVVRL